MTKKQINHKSTWQKTVKFLNVTHQSIQPPEKTTTLPAGRLGAARAEAADKASQQPPERFFRGQDHPSKRKKTPKLEQWVEIRIENGETITRLYPNNEQLIKRGRKMLPPPLKVIRRLHFRDGVPSEYEWVGLDDTKHRHMGGVGLQRMTVDMWLEAIAHEAAAGTGHIGPVINLPSDKRECECATCKTNSEILQRLEAEAIAVNRPADTDSLIKDASQLEQNLEP